MSAMKKRTLSIIIFGISLITLIISVKLFWNMGIYADEYGSSPVLVDGGMFWLCMDWLRLALLFVLCIASGVGIIRSSIEK